jgi:thioredoxin 1
MKNPHSVLIPAGLITLLVFSGISCNKSSDSPKAESLEKHVTQISSIAEFKTIVENNSGTLLVFDLYADWCAPCKVLAPTFNSLAEAHNEQVKFFRVNVDKSPDIASVFEVRAIPYVVFVRDKEAVHAIAGVNPQEAYERVITACGSAESNEICRNNLGNAL